tara:strand:+ start:176 stop:1477 length:1302 start_codon:yes stop_codon:yes gene_type:complete
MQRLERLERKVVEQAQEATMMALYVHNFLPIRVSLSFFLFLKCQESFSFWLIASCLSSTCLARDENVARKGARAPLSPTLSSALTPCGKARTARNLIIEAKHLESNGQLRDALLFYSKAARLIPENDKLKLKVKGLRADVEAEENVEMVDATNHAKVKGSLVQKLQEASEKRLSSGKSKKLAGTKPKPAQVMLKDITNTNREGSGGARAGKKPQKMKLASSWNCEEDDDNHSLITSEEDDEDEDFEDPGERDDVPWPGLEDVEATVLQILKGGERKALLKLKGIGPKRADVRICFTYALNFKMYDDERKVIQFFPFVLVGYSGLPCGEANYQNMGSYPRGIWRKVPRDICSKQCGCATLSIYCFSPFHVLITTLPSKIKCITNLKTVSRYTIPRDRDTTRSGRVGHYTFLSNTGTRNRYNIRSRDLLFDNKDT